MATARSSSRDVVEALRLGANDYVTKPLDFPMVMARLEGQVAIRREMLAHRNKNVLVGESDGLPMGAVLDDRYEICGRVGEGGFAVVYKAKQMSTGQEVAVKMLRSSRLFTKGESVHAELERFKREVQVIAEVAHPALVRLIDSGTLEVQAPDKRDARERAREIAETVDSAQLSDTGSPPSVSDAESLSLDVPYLVMEYLQGETLGDRLFRSAIPLHETLDLLFPVLGGVHALHARQIVHRDLKPSNILLRERGGHIEPKLVDFGIAKLIRDDTQTLTAASSFLGTPRYMSPEQAVGSDLVDARSDQYSLGVILYECVAGRGPYESKGYAHLIYKVSEGEFTRLDEVYEGSSRLVEIVHRALSKNPADRYPDLMAFGRALLDVASAEQRARWQSLF
jgi:serine/threonine-protein kinase